MQNVKRTKHNYLPVFCILQFALCIGSCSIPNLEPVACTESRNAAREFYSFHFGNEMRFSRDELKERGAYLTRRLARQLETAAEGTDPFTTSTADIPKAFRIGECSELSPARARLQVLLFWRDDVRSEEREVFVEVENIDEQWLIDKVPGSQK